VEPAAPTAEPPARLRRPLVGLALFFGAGVALGLRFAPPSVTLFLAAGFATALCAAWRPRLFPVLHLAALLTGWVAADLEARNPSPSHVARLLGRDREYAMASAVVNADPVLLNVDGDDGLWSVSLDIEDLRRSGRWVSSHGGADALWRALADAPPAAYGERWLLGGSFQRNPETGTLTPVRLYVDPGSARRTDVGQGDPLMAWCLAGRVRCAETLSRGIDGATQEAGFLRAMMLGLREDLPDDVFRAFADTGTLHIVAISGTHIGVACMVLLAVFQAMGVSRRYWILLLAPLLVLYTLATGMSASAVRACVMALVFSSAPLVLRKADGATALAFAALAILAWRPSQLIDPGFILSFGIVGGLMVFYAPIARPLDRLLMPDPWRLQPEALPVRFLRWLGRGLGAIFAASVAAWLISTPMTALLFNNVSPVSLIANLLVIPLSSCMLLTGFLSLAVGAFAPFFTEVFNHANVFFAGLLLRIVTFFNAIPGGSFNVVAPSILIVSAWYVISTALVLGTNAVRRLGAWAATAGLAAAVVVYAGDRDVRVAVLGTGRAAVALCDVPGQGDILVNAGDAGAGRRVMAWLREQGVDRLGVLVLAAPSADVASGALALIDELPVREVWISPQPSRSAVFRDVLREAERRGIRITTHAMGDRGELAGGVEWEVLHPGGDAGLGRAADGALVLRFARGPSSVVIRAPSAPAQDAAMLGSPLEASADVVVWAGSEPGEAWLAKAGSPRAIHPAAYERAMVRLDE
jgi:ComEC/Rec2-related protein